VLRAEPPPIEPPQSRWAFPPAHTADEHEVVGLGADLEAGTLLMAYRSGLFPMPLGEKGRIGWFSPDPRGILRVDDLKISRSLRRSCRRFEIRIDTAFETVMARCGDPRRPHGWINGEFLRAYTHLHELGWAHSVECWSEEGDLVGGLYGIAIGGLFAGESMFHERPDASKVALVSLVERLAPRTDVLIDVQWTTDHLVSLGASEVDREDYLERLADLVGRPQIRLDRGAQNS